MWGVNLFLEIIFHFFLKKPTPLLNMPPSFCFPTSFFHLPSYKTSQFPQPNPLRHTVNPPTSSSTLISNSSHWRYLFSATNLNHLNPDETIQNSIHLLFFILLHGTSDWLLTLLLRMTLSFRIVEEEKNKFMFKHMAHS